MAAFMGATATKETELADYSVCTTWGLKGKQIYLLHLLRKKMEYPELKNSVKPSALTGNSQECIPNISNQKGNHFTLSVGMQIKRCGYGVRLLVGNQTRAKRDERLIRNVATGRRLMECLTSGEMKSIGEIVATEGMCKSQVTRMIYRAYLAPDIVKSILAGTQPPTFISETLKQNLTLPIAWEEQRRLFGFKRAAGN
jgi:hypothetical protein